MPKSYCFNPHPKFVFLDRKGNLPHPSGIDHAFYRTCDKCGIMRRSPHKARKTYISTLIDNNVNLNFIREQVGHEDEKTTLKNYCFDRATKEENIQMLQKALV